MQTALTLAGIAAMAAPIQKTHIIINTQGMRIELTKEEIIKILSVGHTKSVEIALTSGSKTIQYNETADEILAIYKYIKSH